METLINVENEWNDSTGASKVEDAERRIGLTGAVCNKWYANLESTFALWGC